MIANIDTSNEFSIEWFLELIVFLLLDVCLKEMIQSSVLSLKNDEGLFKGFLNLITNSSISDDKVSTSWIIASNFLNELCLFLLKKLFCFNLSSCLVFVLDKLLVLFDLVIFLVVNN